MKPVDLVRLAPLMARTAGRPEVAVGLVDGFVAADQPAFDGRRIRLLSGEAVSCAGGCDRAAPNSRCLHGTFVAGVLSAERSSAAPGICPDCTLLIRPIFEPDHPGHAGYPNHPGRPRQPGGAAARLEDLAAAIVETVDAGARVLNLSVAPERPSNGGHRELTAALDHAANRGVITVVAAGNQGRLAGSVLTRHPWTIPVVAYDARGRPMNLSNLGGSIGGRGIGAPGEAIVSLGPGDRPLRLTGTSAAVPFVVGTVALLLSQFPQASPTEVRHAVERSGCARRRTVVPPLLDAWAAWTGLLPPGAPPNVRRLD
ncbi:S8 family serine peptidase [Kitasatospora azatica]|uniref:S8 family serine peptidase n=1 Tax=Kitasatospora azatica TaxID=58347 RepID=UPI00055CCE56|nr:S8 family serine peptidase [Kitasatospora azatica]